MAAKANTKVDIVVVVPRAGRSVFYEDAEVSKIRALQYAQSKGYRIGTKNISGANVAKNRIRGVEEGLGCNPCWVMFIDDDMVLPEDTIPRLIEADKDIVSGFAVSRRPPFFPCAFMHDKRTFYRSVEDWPEDTLMEVDGVGGACLLVKADVFKNLKKPWFHFYSNYESSMGEDLYFCRKVKRKGYDIWLDTGLIIGHIGDCAYTIYDHLAFREQQKELKEKLNGNNDKRPDRQSIVIASR